MVMRILPRHIDSQLLQLDGWEKRKILAFPRISSWLSCSCVKTGFPLFFLFGQTSRHSDGIDSQPLQRAYLKKGSIGTSWASLLLSKKWVYFLPSRFFFPVIHSKNRISGQPIEFEFQSLSLSSHSSSFSFGIVPIGVVSVDRIRVKSKKESQ